MPHSSHPRGRVGPVYGLVRALPVVARFGHVMGTALAERRAFQADDVNDWGVAYRSPAILATR